MNIHEFTKQLRVEKPTTQSHPVLISDSENDFTRDGFKRSCSHRFPIQRNLESTRAFGVVVPKLNSVDPEPILKTNLNMNRENPIFVIFIKLRNLFPIHQQHTLSRESSAEAVRTLFVLKVRPPRHVDVSGCKPNTLVKRGGLNGVVVDLDLLVWVLGGDVENHVIAEGGVGVVEFGEVGVGDVESKTAGGDEDVQD